MRLENVAEFLRAVDGPDDALAVAALAVARIAYPALDLERWLRELDALGHTARQHIELGAGGNPARRARLRVVSEFFFGQLGFVGNREHYEDPRNSFLNDVLARRTGIPISLAIAFIEVARRAGLTVEGVNFPGHFLVRCPPDTTDPSDNSVLIVDPFHGGVLLDDGDCLRLLRTHAGAGAELAPNLLEPASKRAIVVRMLLNLKRSYVRLRSFGQAREVTELLVALDPSALTELRDKGLLASHLQDYGAALRDLETWLRLASGDGDETSSDVKEVWDHVKLLRRRLASFN